jgi:hypothetical protein
MQPLLQVETRPGKALQVRNTRFIPFAQSYRMIIPGFQGGLVWNRPVSILTVYPDGSEIVTPVPDVTRRIQIMIWTFGLLGGFVLWLLNRKLRTN